MLELSARELIEAFRTRELSPVWVLAAVERRTEEMQPTVNAVAESLHDTALDAARESEARYSGRGDGAPRLLEGVPVAVKEEHQIAGRPLRLGSLVTSTEPMEVTHPVVDRVRQAGGVVHARTTTPEFCIASWTHSDLWGITRNPWNLDYGPGGSSGGAAAVLASDQTFLSTGSDMAGSIRMPASFCGIVGFKPPHGRVPGLAPFTLDSYVQDGPLARTVRDCALLQNAISGQHPKDPVTLRDKVWIPDDLTAWKGKTVAYAASVGDFPVDPDVAANTHKFAEALRVAGCVVDEVELPLRREVVAAAVMTHYGITLGPSIQCALEDERIRPYTRQVVERSADFFARIGPFKGMELEVEIQQVVSSVLADYDALVCPTLLCNGFVAGDDYYDHQVVVDGTEVDFQFEASLTAIFNLTGRHPVLAVPSGLAANGVPTGVQIVGRPFDDVTPFMIGAAAESVLGWWNDPAWRPPIWQSTNANTSIRQ